MPEMRQGVTDIFVRQALDGAASTQPGDDLAQMVAQSDGNTAVPALQLRGTEAVPQLLDRLHLCPDALRIGHRLGEGLS